MSAVSPLASVDWPTVGAAFGTFIGAIYLTIKGIQKGRSKVESGKSDLTPIVGASIIESSSMVLLSEALRTNAEAVRENTAELKRANDIEILTRRK